MILKVNQDTSGILRSIRRYKGWNLTPGDVIARYLKKSNIQNISKIYQKCCQGQHLRSDSEPKGHTIGIYVKKHHCPNREFFIWIRFDFLNADFRMIPPCCWRKPWFMKRVPWKRMLRTMMFDIYSNCVHPRFQFRVHMRTRVNIYHKILEIWRNLAYWNQCLKSRGTRYHPWWSLMPL